MSTKPSDTIQYRQQNQPWKVPYAEGVNSAASELVPHILGSHCALHVMKSAGKIAAVFEALDHPQSYLVEYGSKGPGADQLQTLKDMSADLLTEALRFANLYGFDLAAEHERRVAEKNP